jgi:S1-C subfamily serine protease
VSDMDTGGVSHPDEERPAGGPESIPPRPEPANWGERQQRASSAWWSAADPEPARRGHRGRAVIAAAVAGLVLLAGGIGIGWDITRSSSPPKRGQDIRTVSPGSSSTGTGKALSTKAIARKVDPAVVDVNTIIDAFGGNRIGGQAAGTGMVVTSSGEVLTNNHVIAGATSIRVTIMGRSGTFPATVIGAAPTADVALLQIQGVSGLPTVTLADSSRLTIGQRVVAIGNALGRGGTPSVTEGVISALHRSITAGTGNGQEQLSGLIQSNAPISPGDSGGPLLNAQGQVVGMITAASTADQNQQTSTVGFAISTNAALGIINRIRAGQSSPAIILGQPGFLGVDVRPLDPATAAQLGLSGTSGVLVAGVIPGTPAARIGIPQNAVITAINGRRVTSPETLGPAIYTHKPGERIDVTYVDGNGTHTVSVALMAGPAV